jgi:hypothetical protein
VAVELPIQVEDRLMGEIGGGWDGVEPSELLGDVAHGGIILEGWAAPQHAASLRDAARPSAIARFVFV